MSKKPMSFESQIEKSIERVLAHPAFLGLVSQALNFNSARKIWMRQSLEAMWRELELPIREDQQKLLLQVEQLQLQIKKLELELHKKENQQISPEPSPSLKSHLDVNLELQ